MHSTCIAVCQTRCRKAWERPALRSQQRTSGILPRIPCSYTAGHRGKDSFSKIISTARHTWCHSNLGFSVLTCILSPLSKNILSVFATISAYCKTPKKVKEIPVTDAWECALVHLFHSKQFLASARFSMNSSLMCCGSWAHLRTGRWWVCTQSL